MIGLPGISFVRFIIHMCYPPKNTPGTSTHHPFNQLPAAAAGTLMMHHGKNIHMLPGRGYKKTVNFKISTCGLKMGMDIPANKSAAELKSIVDSSGIFFQGNIERTDLTRFYVSLLRECPFQLCVFINNNLCNRIDKMVVIIIPASVCKISICEFPPTCTYTLG